MQIAHFSDSSNMFSLAVPSAAAVAGCAASEGAAEAACAAAVASAETATALTLPGGRLE